MKKHRALFFSLVIFSVNILYAAASVSGAYSQSFQFKDWSFIENKGQLSHKKSSRNCYTHGISSNSDVKYYGQNGMVGVYCKPGQISFVFAKTEKEPEQISEATSQPTVFQLPKGAGEFGRNQNFTSKISTCCVDLILLNSNPNAQMIASNQQEYYENFYSSNPSEEGITHVHTYKTVIYKSIYPFIDLVLHAKEQGMKYEFVVYPGGKVGDIQIDWKGIKSIKKLKDLGVEYSCSLGKITENKPFSYQDSKEIASAFLKKYNLIGFKVSKYDKSKTLIIDPVLNWATYTGGNVNNYSTSIALDDSDNTYITGTMNSATNPNQTKYGGVFVSKFTHNGKLIWNTYFGGPNDIGYSIATDLSGNVVTTGNTFSDTGIATTGAFQTNPSKWSSNGDRINKAFVVKFSSSGIRLWGTYFGGNQGECGYGVATDHSGNILITGNTTSIIGVSTSGAWQSDFQSGSLFIGDAFIAKFSQSGSLVWSTYYGGNGEDEGTAIAVDTSGDVFITGMTGSSYGIATEGAFQTSIPMLTNERQAFIAKFSNSGNLLWGTYYGSNGLTQGNGIAIDHSSGSVVITGYTTSDSGLATSGAYQTSSNSIYDAFLARFSASGNRLWSTYFGGSGQDAGYGISTDQSGNTMITGLTLEGSGIASSGAYQTLRGGDEDAFLEIFNNAGYRTWGTYFGGSGQDIGYGVAASNNGEIYISGLTTSDSLIATRGAFQTNNYGLQDAFIAKFNVYYHDMGISSVLSDGLRVCPGGNNIIKVLLKNFGTLNLDSATIGWTLNEKLQKPIHWIGKLLPDSSTDVSLSQGLFTTGIDSVKTWVSNPNGVLDSFPDNDTFRTVIAVNPLPTANIGHATYSICSGTHIKIGANAQPNFIYSWSSVPSGFNSTLPDPVVNPGANTTYNLTVTDTITGCSNANSANVNVSVLKAPPANAGTNQRICSGVAVQIGSNAAKGNTYLWTSNPLGYTSTIANPLVSPSQTTSYSLTVTNTNDCTNFDSVTIFVNPRPHIIIGTPQNICSQTVIQLGIPSTAGNIYQWTSKPIGFISNLSNPIDSPHISREYYLKEIISATGCEDSDSVRITVIPRPNVAVTAKNIGGFEYQFTVNNPNYPALQYHWNFGDSASGKQDTVSGYNVFHVYSKNGEYTISLTIRLPGYCTEIDSESIDINQSFSLNIYPNPFGLQTNIQYLLTSPGHVKITLLDDVGRNIGTLEDKQLNQGEYDIWFSGAAWKTRPGMYFIAFQLDDKVLVKKIIQIDSIYY